MFVATKVHVILRRFVVLTWMHYNRELMQHVILWNNIKSTLLMTIHPKLHNTNLYNVNPYCHIYLPYIMGFAIKCKLVRVTRYSELHSAITIH